MKKLLFLFYVLTIITLTKASDSYSFFIKTQKYAIEKRQYKRPGCGCSTYKDIKSEEGPRSEKFSEKTDSTIKSEELVEPEIKPADEMHRDPGMETDPLDRMTLIENPEREPEQLDETNKSEISNTDLKKEGISEKEQQNNLEELDVLDQLPEEQ